MPGDHVKRYRIKLARPGNPYPLWIGDRAALTGCIGRAALFADVALPEALAVARKFHPDLTVTQEEESTDHEANA